MRSYNLSIVLVVFLTSCASTYTPVTAPVNTSFVLQINQAFTSLPNYTRVYFQQGMRIPKGSLDRWTTYCRLHVFNPDKEADYTSSVTPGNFAVSKVSNRVESSDIPVSGTGFYGSVGIGMPSYTSQVGLNRSRHDGPPAYYLYRVVMILNAADQPDVQSLTCSRKWATRGNYYPTLEEIRRALGDQVEIVPLSISTGDKLHFVDA